MSSPQKRKGTAFETALVRYLRETAGIDAYRPAQAGRADVGDIHGVSPFVVQAKSYKSITDALREGVAGAERQAPAAGEDYGIAIVKRPRYGVGDAYAVMTLDTWIRVLERLRSN